MTCDKYENVLLLAAASNDELDPKLARHLENCSTCRAALRWQKELISRIDSTLRAQVNEAPPLGFLFQLRLQLSKERTPRLGSNRIWHAGAAAALVLLATFYPFGNARQSSVQPSLQTPTMKALQNSGLKQSARASEDSAVRSRHHPKRSVGQGAVLREPEVLVPPDEQKAFAQFVACAARRDVMAQAVVIPVANKTVNRHTDLPQVSSVVIADSHVGRAGQGEWINQTGSSE